MKRPVLLLSSLALALFAGCASPGVSPSRTSTIGEQGEGTIAFVSDVSGNYDIFVLMGDGQLVRLTETDEDESFPAWSPDGSEIAFGRREADDTVDLWVMNADGDAQKRIYDSGSVYLDGISWHPSGRFIYFSRGYFDGPANMSQTVALVSVRRPETQSALLVDSLWDVHFTYSQPAVTADGNWLALGHYESFALPSQQNIYVGRLSSDGKLVTDIVQVTEGQGGDWSPAWSPDGTAIAWVHETAVNSGNHDIYIMNADGSGNRLLTFDPGQETDPVWSAGGQKIVYASDKSGSFQLYVQNSSGEGEPLQLTDNDANNLNPDWEP